MKTVDIERAAEILRRGNFVVVHPDDAERLKLALQYTNKLVEGENFVTSTYLERGELDEIDRKVLERDRRSFGKRFEQRAPRKEED